MYCTVTWEIQGEGSADFNITQGILDCFRKFKSVRLLDCYCLIETPQKIYYDKLFDDLCKARERFANQFHFVLSPFSKDTHYSGSVRSQEIVDAFYEMTNTSPPGELNLSFI